MTYLADSNLLIALAVVDHVHHGIAVAWLDDASENVATCPITEGALIRFLVREGLTASNAADILAVVHLQEWHEFWADGIPYSRGLLNGVIGHRQVTDAYLVGLALHNRGKLATLDQGLAALHGDDVLLVS